MDLRLRAREELATELCLRRWLKVEGIEVCVFVRVCVCDKRLVRSFPGRMPFKNSLGKSFLWKD